MRLEGKEREGETERKEETEGKPEEGKRRAASWDGRGVEGSKKKNEIGEGGAECQENE